MTDFESEISATYIPFPPASWGGFSPTKGTDWVFPALSKVSSAANGNFSTNEGPGFGCLVSPNSQLGYSIFNTSTATTSILCPPGFLCPYLNVSNPSTYPVIWPAGPICTFQKLWGRQCLVMNHSQNIWFISSNHLEKYLLLNTASGYFWAVTLPWRLLLPNFQYELSMVIF